MPSSTVCFFVAVVTLSQVASRPMSVNGGVSISNGVWVNYI